MRFGKRVAVLVTLAVAAFLTPVSAGSAVAATPAAEPLANCYSWIDGEWGHGRCHNTTGGWKTMALEVECDAWWDSNVHKTVRVGPYGEAELQGHCYSSVAWVNAYMY